MNNYKDADMDFTQYADNFKNMRTNNVNTASEARKLLYHNIKNIKHQYKRKIFFNNNTKNDNKKQQNDSNEVYNELTNDKTKKEQKEKITNKQNDNNYHDKKIGKEKETTTNNPKEETTNKQNDVYDHGKTLQKDILISGISLNNTCSLLALVHSAKTKLILFLLKRRSLCRVSLTL